MDKHQGTEASSGCALDVFNIIEGKDGRSRWVKVGIAFINKDRSINVFLDVLPKDGKLQIRQRKKR